MDALFILKGGLFVGGRDGVLLFLQTGLLPIFSNQHLGMSLVLLNTEASLALSPWRWVEWLLKKTVISLMMVLMQMNHLAAKQ